MKSALGLSLVLALAGFVPLFGGPRYEAALLAGLIGPLWTGIAAAWAGYFDAVALAKASAADGLRRPLLGGQVLLRGGVSALMHLGGVLLVALLHGFRVGFCEPGWGVSLLVLGPGMGMFLSSALGAIVGTALALAAPRGSRGGLLLALLLSMAFPLGSIALGLLHFHASPAVYAYDPFVGYFSGPLYDTVIYDIERLLTFRAGTVMTLLALAGVLSSVTFWFEGNKRGTRLLDSTKERLVVLVVGVMCAVGSVWHSALAEDLGHSSSADSIQKALGRVTQLGRCQVYFSRAVEARVARRTAAECVGHLDQLERYFDVESGADVEVYLFANAEEKRRQMGAAHTYIAKPWRREIYIQPGDFPHQVLGHELAHVVTGEFGAGPMKIAGVMGGWIPDPGRIEGFAVAASPGEHSEGTLHEWTAAMKRLNQLPSLHTLFRLTFLGTSAAKSYSASGSFVDFVHSQHGPEVLKAWYGGASLESLVQSSWPQLEKDWHAFLDAVDVPADVLEIARPRFSRPGVFERRCPHAVDRTVAQAHAYCPVQEAKARALADEAIAMDPTKRDLDLSMARCAWYAGDASRAVKSLTKLASDELTYEPNARRAALDFAGNVAWNQGKTKEAKALYGMADDLTFRPSQRRQLEAKIWALDQSPEIRSSLRALMAPSLQEEVMPLRRLVDWSHSKEHSSFARYLLARASWGAGHEDERLLFDIDAEELPFASLRQELGRMQLLAVCQQVMRGADPEALAKVLKAYQAQELNVAESREARRVSERCEIAGSFRRETE